MHALCMHDLCIISVWSLFYSIRIYISPHFLPILSKILFFAFVFYEFFVYFSISSSETYCICIIIVSISIKCSVILISQRSFQITLLSFSHFIQIICKNKNRVKKTSFHRRSSFLNFLI